MYMCCIICSFEIVTSFNSSDLCIDENDVRVLKKSLTSGVIFLTEVFKITNKPGVNVLKKGVICL